VRVETLNAEQQAALIKAAVDGVSFSARAGEVTGYLGPNGSGKSTTMKMITGLIEMTSGKILFDGEPIQRDLIAYKQRMGYVPEEPHLYGHLMGLEYLVMVGQLRNLPVKPTADRIDGLLRLFALRGDRHVAISSYSQGMRQKVLLSAALMHNPDLILLDEPFSALDVGTALVLLNRFETLRSSSKGRPLFCHYVAYYSLPSRIAQSRNRSFGISFPFNRFRATLPGLRPSAR